MNMFEFKKMTEMEQTDYIWNNKEKFRLKTKEEFKQEFGSGWMHKIRAGYVYEMEKYLGKDVIDIKFEKGKICLRKGFSYSMDMFILKNINKKNNRRL